MANPDEGEVGFNAKGREWTLSFSNRALRALEKKFEKPIADILGDFQNGLSQSDLLVVFVEGLRLHHPDVKEDDADILLRPVEMLRVVGDALQLAFGISPETEGAKPNGAAGHPQVPSQNASTGSAA